jgi:hypothetical protein
VEKLSNILKRRLLRIEAERSRLNEEGNSTEGNSVLKYLSINHSFSGSEKTPWLVSTIKRR